METLDALLPANAGERRTLADIIFSKLENVEQSNAAIIQKSHQGCLIHVIYIKTILILSYAPQTVISRIPLLA
jgi:hypothetical protein